MKHKSFTYVSLPAAMLAVSTAGQAALFTFTPGVNIPDFGQISNTQTLAGVAGTITGIGVQLAISGIDPDGAYNGDFHVLLTYNGYSSVLLNRIGSAGGSLGFSGNGLNIALSDSAATDIHTGGSGDPLTGTWQPDGRATHPDLVEPGDPRTAMLGGFLGFDPNGSWTLQIQDSSQGFSGKLDSWALDLTLAIPQGVPDGGISLAAMAGIFGSCLAVRRRASR